MDDEMRDRLIERGARVLAAHDDWPWDDLSEWARNTYRREVSVVIDALGIEATNRTLREHAPGALEAWDGSLGTRPEPIAERPLFRICAAEDDR
jgi:hypothetical protein